LGFASVLGEFGLPEAQFIPALIGFNIGVEIGQLTVVAVAFLMVFAAQRVDLGRMVSSLAGWGYVAGALVLLAASVAQAMGQGAWMPDAVFLWGAAGLMILCMLSVFFVDQLDSYRRFVAVPASVFIGAVGAFWVVERLFL
jgi:phosphoglycerol transferase MdoB-like AlkP superfamily enzyme